jgi:hypothetical protein
MNENRINNMSAEGLITKSRMKKKLTPEEK